MKLYVAWSVLQKLLRLEDKVHEHPGGGGTSHVKSDSAPVCVLLVPWVFWSSQVRPVLCVQLGHLLASTVWKLDLELPGVNP